MSGFSAVFAAGLVLVAMFLATVAALAAVLGAPTTDPVSLGGTSTVSGDAGDDIPAPMLALYQQAAAGCPSLDWAVLAAVGKIETDHGRSPLPGVRSGENHAGAAGPMQFLAPTFAEVTARHPPPPGGARPPSRYNAHDSVHTAAAYLCDSGARAGLGRPADIRRALYAYNHSDSYVAQVLDHARRYTAAQNAGALDGRGQQDATVPDPSGTGGQITPRLDTVYRALDRAGALTGGATCWDPHLQNPDSDHPRGRACDVFFDPSDPAEVARGWQVARWLTTSQSGYGITYLIWQGRIWTAESPTWSVYTSSVYGCPDPANVTGCHYDHIHISVT